MRKLLQQETITHITRQERKVMNITQINNTNKVLKVIDNDFVLSYGNGQRAN